MTMNSQDLVDIHDIRRLVDERVSKDAEILFIADTGSYAQGYATPESDNDIKCIYARPADQYLTLWPHKDNFESKSQNARLEVVGWDITKFLTLMRNSNPQTFEWLHSTQILFEQDVVEQLRDLADLSYSQAALANHYLGMLHKTKKQRVSGRTIPVKRYITLVQNACALNYILLHNEPPVMYLPTLVAHAPYDIQEAANNLLTRRRLFGRNATTLKVDVIDSYVNETLRKSPAKIKAIPPKEKPDPKLYDDLFVSIVKKI